MSLRDIPMRHMFGVKIDKDSNLRRNYRNLLRGSDTLMESTLDRLRRVLVAILDMPSYEDFDRVAVQLTSRLIVNCRAGYHSLKSGHLISATSMARDAVEVYAACHFLHENKLLVEQWISASTFQERRRFWFSKLLNSFEEGEREALKGIHDTLSNEVHANHLAVTYVRSRVPVGINYYQNGCYLPGIASTLLGSLLAVSLQHLDWMRYSYYEIIDLTDICSGEILLNLRRERTILDERLRRFVKRADRSIAAREKAGNLSNEELELMEDLVEFVESRNSDSD